MSATPKQKKKSKFWPIMGITATLIVTALCFLWRHAPDKKTLEANRRGTMVVREADTGVIVITTKYPGIPLHTDPDQRMTAAPIMKKMFAWEKAINGIPVKRFIPGKDPIDLVDTNTIGVARTIAYRIVEGQGYDKAELAYVKHRERSPPSGWFDAALNTRR